jgi:multicomponent Na+:H+ antiporter subunit F
MNGPILQASVWVALVGLSLALCSYRVLKGPTVADRVVALDAASVMLMGLLVAGSMRLGETKYLDYALVLAMLSFVATIAFARYVERGVIIERDSD